MPLVLPRETHFHHPLESVVFHFWHPEKSISLEHTHEYCELFLVSQGSAIHVINEKPYLLTAGTLCYLNRQDYHLFDEMKDLNRMPTGVSRWHWGLRRWSDGAMLSRGA